jgi:two-component system sensor histidine kinase/response regulator
VRAWLQRLPMKSKLMLLAGVVTAFALLISGTLLVSYAYSSGKKALISRLQTQASNTAFSSAAALMFDDREAALKSLQALAADSAILGAEIVRTDGSSFTSHLFGERSLSDLQTNAHVVRATEDIELDGRIGTVYVWADDAELWSMLLKQLAVLLATTLTSLGVALVAAARLQRFISGPIVQLADTAMNVSVSRDYSLRASYIGSDEVGRLVASFNQMLTQIESQSVELQAHKAHLEGMVEARTADLASALKDARAAAQAKADFLANMSHEIRTPMNGVIGMLDLMDAGSLDPQRRSMLETARNSAEALLGVINDVLDFSKIDAGKLALEQIDVELRPLAEEIATLFSRQAHDKGVEITCLVEADVPPVVRTDPTRLRQVLANLLGNAIKFTESGEVGLVVRRLQSDEQGAQIEITVNDTGIGMTDATIASLFQSFTQADSSTTRRFGGTGLGLAICKRLVDAMRGTIAVRSEVDRGSSFSITLPMPIGSAPLRKARADLSKLRVLIVDDNATNRLVLEHYATALRMQYRMAPSAVEALSYARESVALGKPFDLVLLDYHMPEVDGLSLLRQLRDIPNIGRLECIVLSSLGDRAAGVDTLDVFAWLSKPVRLNQLYSAIATSAGLTSSWERYQPEQPSLRAVASPSATFAGRVLLVEDNAVNRQVASRLLATLGLHPTIAVDGAEGVEQVSANEYDLVLMDCQMPTLDGYQATAAIRALEAERGRSRLPIIAMTANAMEGDRERCIDAGMDDYLAKPVTRATLANTLQRWLPRSDDRIVASPAVVHGGEDGGVDRQALEQLRALFEGQLAEVLDTYLRDTPLQLDRMTEALHTSDNAALARAAHSLRASSYSVGAKRVSELAARLDRHARVGGSMNESREMLAELRIAHAAAEPILHAAAHPNFRSYRCSGE